MTWGRLVCAITTPFDDDGALDLAAFRRTLMHIEPHVDAAFVAGTTGEFPALAEAERHDLFTTALDVLGPDRTIAHVGAVDAVSTVRIAADAALNGVTGFAAITPYYLPASVGEVQGHLARVREAVTGTLLGYFFPDRTGVDLDAAAIASVIAGAGLDGAKLSGRASGVVSDVVRATASLNRSISVYSGNDGDLEGVLSQGGSGIVSGCSTAFPELFAEAAAALDDTGGWGAGSETLRADLSHVAALVAPSIGRVKYALSARGVASTAARMSVDPPHADVRSAIVDAVAALTRA
ncbi:dihydrodipicolinate synthase family protein [Frondihabitans australicus]|uniref:4-hydroxy-tetrahydrodipicolinate synthase n=1 Tax=Frondihabitans australicus TaxID=386892 RepID=A0A495IDQ5_9MICO|nr:dihydrodipicolinate synthase family protein [Frondihabitans australicus]RKR73618.1 4-hydroxy-tetrahydrodipicolinate synthase [Frondihabitans australicus]